MREKLIELIEESTGCTYGGEYGDEVVENEIDISYSEIERIADHLIANLVVISNSETTTKWIPVTDRLPERDGKYLCNYHFSEHRNMTFTHVLDYYATDKAPHFQHENSYGMKVSHWMPLPEPPKGE